MKTASPRAPGAKSASRAFPLAAAMLAAVLAASPRVLAAPGDVLGTEDARHLLARTGFGPTAAEVAAFAALSRREAVDRLLDGARTKAGLPPPAAALTQEPIRFPGPSASVEERREFNRRNVREGLELRAWWLQEMTSTPSPLTERMTLFWHNHFVSSQQKVRFARLMYEQNATLREHALGSFAALLRAAAKDPAMLVYLDGAQNRRGQPNENFAREVMELFTLGEGRYTEQDVKEAARAFTGWSVDRDTGGYVFRRGMHDPSVKTVLGRSGRFDGDAVLDVLLEHEATAVHVVGKLWREFVSPDPDAVEVRRIAADFRRSGYAIKGALRELLLADAFYAAENRGVLVKSPVELVVGALRQLEIVPGDGLPFAFAAAGMGQNVFAPPNVKGWPGGEVWINANTLLARKQFLERLARADAGTGAPMRRMAAIDEGTGAPAIAAAFDDDRERRSRTGRTIERGMRDVAFDATAWVAARGASVEERVRAVRALLLPLPAQSPAADDAPPSVLVRTTLLDPA
ncbi:MAG: DUF1800 domain-containing protein, partial [Betaproteobacteria bacterium]|nr:DUF1800 domain-containing protein [Betaproteobacteria bacterium]